jgi:hypothetical protein
MASDGDAVPLPEPDPPAPRRSPINPFEAALRRRAAPEIRVCWTLNDMQNLRPDWTAFQCDMFLRRHTTKFAAAMIRVGLELLASMAADPEFRNDGNSDGGSPKPSPPSPPNN